MATWLDSVMVRKMREEDLPLIEWDGEYERYRKVYREVYRNQLNGLTTALIAESPGDGIIGQIFLTAKSANPIYSPKEPYLFISSFRIKEPFRNRGLGSLLLRMAEIVAREKRLELLVLNCARANESGLSFYKKHGFEGFRMDDSVWRYVDHEGKVREERKPAWSMRKRIGTKSDS